MDFGITIKPDMTIDRIVSLTRQAEAAGFSDGWIFDSHVIWMEPFPLLTLMAANTKNMRLGTCVTNPAVRDVTVSSSLFATLNVASQGRMQMGIGRGDSSRRVLGKKPTTLENLEEFVRVFDLMSIQRNFKAIGSFASFYMKRQDVRYLKFIGNTFENIRRNLLKFPELDELRYLLYRYYYF